MGGLWEFCKKKTQKTFTKGSVTYQFLTQIVCCFSKQAVPHCGEAFIYAKNCGE